MKRKLIKKEAEDFILQINAIKKIYEDMSKISVADIVDFAQWQHPMGKTPQPLLETKIARLEKARDDLRDDLTALISAIKSTSDNSDAICSMIGSESSCGQLLNTGYLALAITTLDHYSVIGRDVLARTDNPTDELKYYIMKEPTSEVKDIMNKLPRYFSGVTVQRLPELRKEVEAYL